MVVEEDGLWAFSSLWKQNCPRIVLGISDTILFSMKNNLPELWLFTSKNGEVVKKRSIATKEIFDRFIRIAFASDQNNALKRVCVLRNKNGTSSFLNKAEFASRIENIAQDNTYVAMQAFVCSQSAVGTIMRNNYKPTNDRARNVTSTYKIAILSDSHVSEGVIDVPKDSPYEQRSMASRINSRLDEITYIVVRHIEELQNVKIKSISIDYTIDSAQQIWLSWIPSVTYVHCTKNSTFSSISMKEGSETYQALDEKLLENADRILYSSTDKSTKSQRISIKKESKGNSSMSSQYKVNSFPTPFKCCGEFCFVVLERNMPNENKASQPQIKYKSTRDFFSQKELNVLEKDLDALHNSNGINNVDQEDIKTEKSFFTITYKSIALAKKEKRMLSAGEDVFPNVALKEKKGSIMDSTISKNLKTNWAKSMGELDGGTANYYRHVKVCKNCYSIYAMLDRARLTLENERMKALQKANEETKIMWNNAVDKEVAAKEKMLLRKRKKSTLSSSNSVPEVSTSNLSSPADDNLDSASVVNFDENACSLPKLGNESTTVTEEVSHDSDPASELKMTHQKAISKKSIKDPPWKECHKGLPSDYIMDYDSNSKTSKDVIGLDNYLRGKSRRRVKKALAPGRLFPKGLNLPTGSKEINSEGNIPAILLAEDNENDIRDILLVLTAEKYSVESVADGAIALKYAQEENKYDLVICSRDLPGMSGIEFVTLLRQFESQRTIVSGNIKRLPFICFTERTSPEDLRVYMESGMDGCISKPLDAESLVHTVTAALPQFYTVAPQRQSNLISKSGTHVIPRKLNTIVDNAKVSTVPSMRLKKKKEKIPATLLHLPPEAILDTSTTGGIFQMDADNSFPYLILGKQKKDRQSYTSKNSPMTLFNLVVVHDIFDTIEKMQIFLQPLVSRYPGVQVLLWNYPGQAFTEWRKGANLNNSYLSNCLSSLLHYVGQDGTKQLGDSPFYILGFGNGGNIAYSYATTFPSINTRGLVVVNGFSFIDPHLAQFFHESIKVFSCSPEGRPDLPIYFHSRFLFSGNYLSRVTSTMALNLYTAVHNPITIEGRIQLCLGALGHIDLREKLSQIKNMPIILVSSTEDGLVKTLHTDEVVTAMGGECDSIHKALSNRRKKPCVVWYDSGHEVFQECKKNMRNLIEQFITGFHEAHESTFVFQEESQPPGTNCGSNKKQNKNSAPSFEDRFIGKVLSTLNTVYSTDIQASSQQPEDTSGNSVWVQYQKQAGTFANTGKRVNNKKNKKKKEKEIPNPELTPEVKEYMAWRVSRNKKRLQRLEKASSVIQRGFRAFMAKSMLRRMKEKQAVLLVQRIWRGKKGREKMKNRRKEEWAVCLVQRVWRGKSGRENYAEMRKRRQSVITIQRIERGRQGRKYVREFRYDREKSAILLQGIWRRKKAYQMSFEKRKRKNAAQTIQRMYRGHLGRKKASRERDCFLFSKVQSEGIEFGRQMLMEHKVYGSRLQSEVALLAKQKITVEEQVESLLEEISEFQEGVTTLEDEMHQLSKIETEAKSALEEDAKFELREQKMRLDREFGKMLEKIADRKEKLENLESQLMGIDRMREEKEEELRNLETKLVLLLEEQQKQFSLIKAKQQHNIGNVDALMSTDGANSISSPSGNGNTALPPSMNSPTPKQREEVNSLMESTETMMKFGFMSMSMTYFSSMNMVKAMRKVGAHQNMLNAAAAFESPKSEADSFQPELKRGQVPGQEGVLVRSWSAVDVGRWLDTLSLGQYKEAFFDAAVDGALLCDLNDDDLKNTLGVEHGLHRKKVLTSIHRINQANNAKVSNLYPNSVVNYNSPISNTPIQSNMAPMQSGLSRAPSVDLSIGASTAGASAVNANSNPSPEENRIIYHFDELAVMVRHGKYKQLKETIKAMPDRKFDKSTIETQYLPDVGTIYDTATNSVAFHINKDDDHGNSLLLLAAQNNSTKIAQLLINKGANANHQNKQGQTAAHYAMAYNFFDLGAWLLDSDKGGGDDDIENMNGLTAYDGLA